MSVQTLDIILPCYNPPADWSRVIPASIAEIAAALGPDVALHVILVNDGSRNGHLERELEALQGQLPSLRYTHYAQNQGKGHALRQGVALARGAFQIYTDIDFPYSTASVVAVYQALTQGGADIAAGVRDAEYYLHVPPIRRFISKFLRWLLRVFLRVKISDTQCGLKGFNAQGRAVFLQTRIHRFLFDLEFIFLASGESKIKLQAVPVQLKPGIEFSKARVSILLRESLNFASIFLRGLWARLRGKRN